MGSINDLLLSLDNLKSAQLWLHVLCLQVDHKIFYFWGFDLNVRPSLRYGRLSTSSLSVVPQVTSANAFAQTLRRYTSLNHLAQAARAVLQNTAQINQMLSDLNRVDFANVQVRHHQIMSLFKWKGPSGSTSVAVCCWNFWFCVYMKLNLIGCVCNFLWCVAGHLSLLFHQWWLQSFTELLPSCMPTTGTGLVGVSVWRPRCPEAGAGFQTDPPAAELSGAVGCMAGWRGLSGPKALSTQPCLPKSR